MVDAAQIFTVGIPTLAVLTGILVDNRRFDALNSQIADLQQHIRRRFDEVDRRITDNR